MSPNCWAYPSVRTDPRICRYKPDRKLESGLGRAPRPATIDRPGGAAEPRRENAARNATGRNASTVGGGRQGETGNAVCDAGAGDRPRRQVPPGLAETTSMGVKGEVPSEMTLF